MANLFFFNYEMLKKVASNTLSQIFSKGITAVISIFLIGMLTKYLSPEMYGQYNKIYNYLSIFTFLADLGLYTISIREISKDTSKAENIIGNVMSLRLLLSFIIIILATSSAYFLPGYNQDYMLVGIAITSFFALFSLLNSSVLSLMQAFMKMEYSLFSLVAGKIVTLLGVFVTIVFLFPKMQNQPIYGFLMILFMGLLGIGINYGLNHWYANKIVKVRFLFDWEYMWYLFKTSLPYGVALFLSVVYFKVDIMLLSFIEGGEKADISIAFYSLPMKIVEVLMVVGMFYLNSILPSLSQYFKENAQEKITQLLDMSFRFLFGFSTLIVGVGILLRHEVIQLIATSDYLDASLHSYTSADAFVVVFFVILFYFVSGIFNYIFIASKNESMLLKINIFITIFNIVGNILLIPKYSFIGSGIVTLASQVCLFGLGYFFAKKIVDFRLNYLYMFQCLLLFFILVWAGEYLHARHNFGVVGNIFIFGGIFFILHITGLVLFNLRLILDKIKKAS